MSERLLVEAALAWLEAEEAYEEGQPEIDVRLARIQLKAIVWRVRQARRAACVAPRRTEPETQDHAP